MARKSTQFVIQVPAILFRFQSFSKGLSGYVIASSSLFLKFCQDDAEAGGSKFEARSHSTRTVGIQRKMSQDWSNSLIQVAYTPLVSRAVNYAYSSKRNVEGKLGAGVPRFIRLNNGEQGFKTRASFQKPSRNLVGGKNATVVMSLRSGKMSIQN